MKRALILIILSMTVIAGHTSSIRAEDARTKILKLGSMDLFVDGSVTPQLVNITGFPVGGWITVMVLNIHFEDASVDFNNWGAGPALTNGTAALIDGDSLLSENLTNNHGFGHISGDLTIFQDDKTPKDNHFVSTLSLFEIVPPFGVQLTSETGLQFLVQDNITAAANAVDLFEVNIEGFIFSDANIGSIDETPDFELLVFLNEQFRIFVGALPWLLLLALAFGIIVYGLKQFKLL